MMKALAGLGTGAAQWQTRFDENGVRVGHDIEYATTMQMAATYSALPFLFQTASILYGSPIELTTSLRLSITAIPLAVSLGVHWLGDSDRPHIRSWLYPIHNNIGRVNLGVVAVAQLFTLYSAPSRSIGTLAGMGAAHMINYSHISPAKKQTFVVLAFLFGGCDSWLRGENAEVVLALLTALLNATLFIDDAKAKRGMKKGREVHPHELDISSEEVNFSGPLLLQCEVDRTRFLTEGDLALPPAPKGVDVGNLQMQFKAIDWTQGRMNSLIVAQVHADKRWKREIQDFGKEIDYVREGLQKYIGALKGEGYTEGFSYDREPLLHRALLLTELLPRLDIEKRALALIKLGLAAHQCDADQLRATDELYRDNSGAKELSMVEQYQLRLATYREDLLRQIVQEGLPPISRIFINPGRLHVSNLLVSTYGDELGLPSRSLTREDRLAPRHPWVSGFYRRLLLVQGEPGERPMLASTRFWQLYTPQAIVEQTRLWLNGGGNGDKPLFSRDEISAWFTLHFPESKGVWSETVLDEHYTNIEDKYVILFAIKAGGLKYGDWSPLRRTFPAPS